jgi:hypothetical protein
MSSYTIQQLIDEGPQYAMALLLESLQEGEPFVTYGAIRDELEYQLGIDNIFSVQIGHVAGSLMDQVLDIDPKAPLINVLITHPDGIPGKGVGNYFADRYGVEAYRSWEKLTKDRKRELIEKEIEKVFRYKKWGKINTKLFGLSGLKNLRKKETAEQDGSTLGRGGYGGEAESKEHKKLKYWVSEHPQNVGIKKAYGKGIVESRLLSGDTIDVLFSFGSEFVTVEVKSIKSGDDDLRRGIYQCVKYRAVKEAEQVPNSVVVRALLVTERELNNELKTRARQLGVKWKCVSVN